MKVQIQEAEQLAQSVLQKLGYTVEDAAIAAHHLIDSELRGYGVAGLARVLSIRDRLLEKGFKDKIELVRDTAAMAQVDGKDTLGYIVAEKATRMAIEKARTVGISCVAAKNTWYTGMLAYYAETAAKEDLVTIIASNASPWVAPEDGYRPMVGTNPFAIGFPSGTGPPILYDIGTSKILHADVLLAGRLGTRLPPDSAYDPSGEVTTDPAQALLGAIAPWGGHRGAGLALAVQLLGVLAGSPAQPENLGEFAFLIVAIDPAFFRPIEEFKSEVDSFATAMRQSPPRAGKPPLRMPFERSAETRAKALDSGEIEVANEVVQMLKDIL